MATKSGSATPQAKNKTQSKELKALVDCFSFIQLTNYRIMKAPIPILLIFLCFFSCKQDDQEPIAPAEVQFALSLKNDNGGRSDNTLTISKIRITVKDDVGNVVIDDETIELISFGNSFTSAPIRLRPGSYHLTSFLVLNDGDTAIFAAPLENSPLAQLVDFPLPIKFEVIRDEVSNVGVEVIAIENSDPSEFGYASFAPIFVPTRQFEIAVFEVDTSIGNIQTTGANLIVKSRNDTIRQISLEPRVNHIRVVDELEEYTLIIIKEGFQKYMESFNLLEIQKYERNNPLEVILEPKRFGTSGTFRDSQQTINVAAYGIALGDLDMDGDIDAILQGHPRNTPTTIWFNDGNGFFTQSEQLLVTTDISDLELADLDSDGDLDIFISNFSRTGNTVWFNDGLGTFQDSGQKIGSLESTNVTLGDLDNDGDIDTFTAISSANGLVWFNDGFGAFDNPFTLREDNGADAAFVDVDSDNDLDIIVASGTGCKLFLNDGAGVFLENGLVTINGYRTITTNDFDGDGDLDLLFVQGSALRYEVALSSGSGFFSTTPYTSSISFSHVAVGDVDGDGDIDAIGASGLSQSASVVLINSGNGTFTESDQTLPNVGSGGLAIEDLNGDGILDVFFANINSGSVFFGQP